MTGIKGICCVLLVPLWWATLVKNIRSDSRQLLAAVFLGPVRPEKRQRFIVPKNYGNRKWERVTSCGTLFPRFLQVLVD